MKPQRMIRRALFVINTSSMSRATVDGEKKWSNIANVFFFHSTILLISSQHDVDHLPLLTFGQHLLDHHRVLVDLKHFAIEV